MTHGEWGDRRPDLVEVALAEQEPNLRRLVGSFRVADGSLREELLQEARVALWRALEAGETETPVLLARARSRVLSVLTGDKPLTGAERYTEAGRTRTEGGYARGRETRQRIREFVAEHAHEHGRPPTQREVAEAVGIAESSVRKHLTKMHEPEHPAPLATTSLDARLEGSEGRPAPALPRAAWASFEAELAAHTGEIAAAVNELDLADRAYVVHRFWADRTGPAIAAALGRPASTLDGRWSSVIRPHLRERLAHLADAA